MVLPFCRDQYNICSDLKKSVNTLAYEVPKILPFNFINFIVCSTGKFKISQRSDFYKCFEILQ